VAAVLDWVAGPGFREFFSSINTDFPFADAQEFRQRALLRALRGFTPA